MPARTAACRAQTSPDQHRKSKPRAAYSIPAGASGTRRPRALPCFRRLPRPARSRPGIGMLELPRNAERSAEVEMADPEAVDAPTAAMAPHARSLRRSRSGRRGRCAGWRGRALVDVPRRRNRRARCRAPRRACRGACISGTRRNSASSAVSTMGSMMASAPMSAARAIWS